MAQCFRGTRRAADGPHRHRPCRAGSRVGSRAGRSDGDELWLGADSDDEHLQQGFGPAGAPVERVAVRGTVRGGPAGRGDAWAERERGAGPRTTSNIQCHVAAPKWVTFLRSLGWLYYNYFTYASNRQRFFPLSAAKSNIDKDAPLMHATEQSAI